MVINGRKAINVILFVVVLLNAVQEFLYSITTAVAPLFYLTDALLVLAFFFMVMTPKGSSINKLQLKAWMLFLGYAIFTFIWSSRNYYDVVFRLRYFVQCIFVLYLTQRYLTDKGLKVIINMLCGIQFINMLLSFYQNRIMGLFADYCNGLFGYIGLGSGSVGIFSVALSILSIIYYLFGKWSPWRSIFVIGISAAFCAFAEVKAYYIVLLVGVVLIFIFQKRNKSSVSKDLITLFAVGLMFYLAYVILSIVFPDNLATLFSVDDYVRYDSRSTYAGRLNTIPFVFTNQFMGSIPASLVGSGIGTSAGKYIYELGKSFGDFGFIGLLFLIFAFLSPFITYVGQKKQTAEQFFVAILSVLMIIGIDIWNVPFVRSIGVIIFFLLGIINVEWTENNNGKKHG